MPYDDRNAEDHPFVRAGTNRLYRNLSRTDDSDRTQGCRRYASTYVHRMARAYSKDDSLADILNLVMHIIEKRPSKEVMENLSLMAE